MLLLTSNGLSSEALRAELYARFPTVGASAAIVTTASADYKAQDWHIPRLTDELNSLGCDAVCFDLDVQPPEELAVFDVIEFLGGNPYYLVRSMRNCHCRSVLQALLQTHLLIGISAGSLALERTIDIIDCFEPQMNDGIGLTDLTGMGLTDLQILPHYIRFQTRYPHLDQIIAEYEDKHHCQLLKLNDGQGVFQYEGETWIV